jgi:hypothetical protein
VDLDEEAKWFIIMPSKSVLQCTNGVISNPADERTKTMSSQNLPLTLLG